jgi:hypothetical protein
MLKRLFLVAALVLPAAHAQATGTLTINVIGKSTVANTAAYGTVVDALSPVNAITGAKVSGVTWSVNNLDFYTDFFGELHTQWESIISPGPQAMTGTMAMQQMVVATTPVGPVYDNSPPVTIASSLVVSQETGPSAISTAASPGPATT